MNININEDVDALSQEIANGPPLFPAPNTIPRVITARFRRKCSRGERRITGYGLFKLFIIFQTSAHSKVAVNKVARDLWKNASRDNKEGLFTMMSIFFSLCVLFLYYILHWTLYLAGLITFFVIRTLFSRTEHRLFETCTILELLVTGL
ncbi:hypothetical protein GLOIN_2v1552530 [Rhizophagus irregularis DAOM 181602=DAOM 197198]|nr:hypothetical protein GLOIN_2v1552530 [Rhizophagus irregularis DAOM 181602=DAOM 197198]